MIQEALVLRLAPLLLRLERLTRYEAAAARSAAAAEPPPDPDEVAPREADPDHPPQNDAPPAQRLAHLRGLVRRSEAEVPALRLAARLLAGGDGPADGIDPAWHVVVAEVGRALGCSLEEAVDCLGFANEMLESRGRGVTGEVLRGLIAEAAADEGLDPDAVTRAVRDGVAARADESERAASRARAGAEGLAERMRARRAEAAAVAALGDDAVVDRVIRVEAHLVRQLDALLGMLARPRVGGEPRVVVREVAPRVDVVGAGGPAALPAELGSFGNGEVREVARRG